MKGGTTATKTGGKFGLEKYQRYLRLGTNETYLQKSCYKSTSYQSYTNIYQLVTKLLCLVFM